MHPFPPAHRRSTPGRLAALLVALVLILAGCSGAAAPSASPVASLGAAPTSTPAPTPPATAAPAFPVTLTDDEGTAVTLPAQPAKIVSLTPASTETLYALDAGPGIVATDDGSDYPAEAASLPHVATFSSVDVEKIVALDPDLVIAGGLGFTPADSIAKLRSLDIPVLVLYAPSVDGVYHDIELLGQATGTTEAATTLTAGMRTRMDAIATAADAAATAGGGKPAVYYEVGYDDTTGEIFAPADNSFVAEMVARAGADPITTGDPASYKIPLETLIAKDPRIIVLGTNPFYMPTPEAVAKRPGWKVMTAVKDGRIVPVQDTEITRPGPRLPIGLANLAKAIWPGITLPATP
ncbi:MAG: ABC transporter substrate-binding protein [Chloroflexota bacterium]